MILAILLNMWNVEIFVSPIRNRQKMSHRMQEITSLMVNRSGMAHCCHWQVLLTAPEVHFWGDLVIKVLCYFPGKSLTTGNISSSNCVFLSGTHKC